MSHTDRKAAHDAKRAQADEPYCCDQQNGPDDEHTCRSDGRCQYAIDHGAEGLGHCPPGKCVMPRADDALHDGQPWPEWFYELDRKVHSADRSEGKESFCFYYDEHEFSIEKDALDRNWYITVASERGYAYDGYWRDSASKDLVKAVVEAFHGSMIPLPAARNDAALPDLADIERQPWRMPAEPFNWPALPVQPGTREAMEREHARRGE